MKSKIVPILGDASFRNFYRLILNNDKLDTIQAISKENKYYENIPLVYLNNLWSGKLLPFENYTTLAKQVKRTYKTLTKDF